MSALKVERLFYSLSDEERRTFRSSLLSRQSGLVRLFDELEALTKSGNRLARVKRQLVQSLYDEPYSDATDARFRDSCRKLAERLEDFLAERQCVKSVAKDSLSKSRFLLEALLERGLWTQFESHYRNARAASIAACDYAALLAIDDLRLRQLWESRTHKPEALSEFLNGIDDAETHLQSHFATTQAHLKSIRAVALHYLRPQTPATTRRSSHRAVSPSLRPPLAQYYEKKSRAFARSLRADLDAMREALRLIMRLKSDSPALRAEQLAALGNMGLAYMLRGDYRNAKRYYEKAFKFSEARRLDFGASLAFNYASVLMKTGDYKEAATLFQSKWETFAKGEMVRHRAEAMRCFCHVFLGEINVAKTLLPPSLAPYPLPVQNYFHFAKVAIRVAANDLLGAEREAQNLLKRFHRNKRNATLDAEKKLISLYQKFIRARQEPSNALRLASFAKIKSGLTTFLNEHAERRDTLPVVWLERTLEGMNALVQNAQ